MSIWNNNFNLLYIYVVIRKRSDAASVHVLFLFRLLCDGGVFIHFHTCIITFSTFWLTNQMSAS